MAKNMIFGVSDPKPSALGGDAYRRAMATAYRMDEAQALEPLLQAASLDDAARARVEATARNLVAAVREGHENDGGLDRFLHEYGLGTKEGVILMCLAEALLRIPDSATADRLIRDKLAEAEWDRHLGHSDSLFVNASTWGLMLTGRVVRLDKSDKEEAPSSILSRMVSRSGAPIIRQALMRAMRIMGKQFVMGRTIEEALTRARPVEAKGYRYSYDMLGEAARTMADAERYFERYEEAIRAIGRVAAGGEMVERASISVKLSALHPRYEFAQAGRMHDELSWRIKSLALLAKEQGIGLTIDAEEADRLDLSLDLIEKVYLDPALGDWDGFGLAVQAYQKRAYALIDWLVALAEKGGRQIPVRLVKGAYWDTEIKRAQQNGLDGYPVFTRKASTDVSYLACARKLLAHRDRIYPQFATHNAHTVAAINEMAGEERGFEYQRLHGMGESLYDAVVGPDKLGVSCRVYAPVGSHEDLLPYLVRRLLENGANTSFVNRIVEKDMPVEELIADPVEAVSKLEVKPHPRIPLPADIYGEDRKNAPGVDLSDPLELAPLADAMAKAVDHEWRATAIVGGKEIAAGEERAVLDPADRRRRVGTVIDADAETAERAVEIAAKAQRAWDRLGGAKRGEIVQRIGDLLWERRAEGMALAIREAGKNIPDAVAEIREAIDFCRYYGLRAAEEFEEPTPLPGPTGEANQIMLGGRGVFLCISPWNFPVAIFTGQVTAALAAGNAVIAKPAEQTSLIAAWAVRLMHEAGVPEEVLHLVPGTGETVGAALVRDPRIAGVAFTGSTETARAINQSLAAKPGPIVPLIAETGGQNAMLVDSSALHEQVVADVVMSAFGSAGQRCSALRVLYLQNEIADDVIEMLSGAMRELTVGDPALLSTDVGPVIDDDAHAVLDAHARKMAETARPIAETPLGPETAEGTFFAPRAFEIGGIEELEREVFGPVLHVARYAARDLDKVVEAVNATGYGLTLGVHTRIDATARRVASRACVGNCYVNRNMIGAVVGVQPFGGEGLSGTGFKAGGPRYLYRFAVERSVSTDTTAAGGNAALMTLGEDG